MPTLLEVMRARLGIQEVPGNKHNPVILEWFRDVGRADVIRDETAWCAACLGSACREAGLPVPPPEDVLIARSWLKWGVPVKVEEARPGDVVIWPRGNPKGWQGHVSVIEEVLANGRVRCIGGNQDGIEGGDAVTRSKSLSLRNALGIRRPPRPEAPEDRVSPARFAHEAARPKVKEAIAVGARSKTLWSLAMSWLAIAGAMLTDLLDRALDWVYWLLGVLPAVTAEVSGHISTTSQIAGWLKLNLANCTLTLVLVLLVVAFVRHWRDRVRLHR